ncbi:hypothetical protein FRC10_002600, partial [Ceratobasidium sp. 414]
DPLVSSKNAEDSTPPRRSANNVHCLRRDLQNLCDSREKFIRSGDEDGLKRWEQTVSDSIAKQDQFAEMLRRFLVHPDLTPMQKEWKKAGDRVDRTPNPEECVFFNNYDTDVENGGSDEDEEERGNDRRHFFHAELQSAKPLAHPFRAVLEALGVETQSLLTIHPSESNENYPFPTTATVLSYPCLSTFHDLKLFQISGHFWDELGHILHHVHAWREDGEEELVEWWKSGTEPTGDSTNLVVKVRGSTAATASLSPSLRLLLRADTVFSYQALGAPGGQGAHLHYPHYYKNADDCPCHGLPKVMNSMRMYRHLEAERVTKAVLRDLGIPDVAYIQLLLMGASL